GPKLKKLAPVEGTVEVAVEERVTVLRLTSWNSHTSRYPFIHVFYSPNISHANTFLLQSLPQYFSCHSNHKLFSIALSSCETEYIIASEIACQTACQVVWLDALLGELQEKNSKKVKLLVDNKFAIDLARHPTSHGRSKHIETRFHFLREQFVDIFTKALKRERFRCLRDSIGIYSPQLLFVKDFPSKVDPFVKTFLVTMTDPVLECPRNIAISTCNIDLPIALRKEPEPAAKKSPKISINHPISKYVTYQNLSPNHRAFSSNITNLNIEEVLDDPNWKLAANESVERYQAKGFTQTYGVDHQETSTLVVKLNFGQILLHLPISLGLYINWM
ncbi:Copia protein, partial [Mucuna pruriens]